MLLLGTPLVGCNNNPDQPDPDKPLPTPTGGDVHYFDATLSSTSTTIGVGETLNIVISNVIDKDGKQLATLNLIIQVTMKALQLSTQTVQSLV